MMLIGFAGIGFMAYRRTKKSAEAVARRRWRNKESLSAR